MSGSKLKAKLQHTQKRPAAKRKRAPAVPAVTPQDFLAQINNKVAGRDIVQYIWEAYGPVAIFVDADLPVEMGSAQIIIDLTTNQICEMHACDYTDKSKKNRAWRWINPQYRKAHSAEVKTRGGFTARLDQFAWDNVRWVNMTPARILERTRELYLRAEGATKKKTRRGTP